MRRVLRAFFTAGVALMFVACGDQPKETSVESPGSRVTPLPPAPPAGEVPSWAKVAPEQIEAAKKAGVPVAFENSIGIRFVLVPAGTFRMGSPKHEARAASDERPHLVTLTQAYYVSLYETTNGQYRHFNKDHDSGSVDKESLNGETQPVVNVTHTDAKEFARWLTGQEGGRTYRLPTESEWEYAARAKTTTRWYWGDDELEFAWNANIADASAKAKFFKPLASTWDDGYPVTAPVGKFSPNAWVLYDMIGNVWEWCSDWYTEDYPKEPSEDPVGPVTGAFRVLRGGSWGGTPGHARAADRFAGGPGERDDYVGFRLVVPAPCVPASGETVSLSHLVSRAGRTYPCGSPRCRSSPTPRRRARSEGEASEASRPLAKGSPPGRRPRPRS